MCVECQKRKLKNEKATKYVSGQTFFNTFPAENTSISTPQKARLISFQFTGIFEVYKISIVNIKVHICVFVCMFVCMKCVHLKCVLALPKLLYLHYLKNVAGVCCSTRFNAERGVSPWNSYADGRQIVMLKLLHVYLYIFVWMFFSFFFFAFIQGFLKCSTTSYRNGSEYYFTNCARKFSKKWEMKWWPRK